MYWRSRMPGATPAMTEDTLLPFDLPAVQRKKVTADFAGPPPTGGRCSRRGVLRPFPDWQEGGRHGRSGFRQPPAFRPGQERHRDDRTGHRDATRAGSGKLPPQDRRAPGEGLVRALVRHRARRTDAHRPVAAQVNQGKRCVGTDRYHQPGLDFTSRQLTTAAAREPVNILSRLEFHRVGRVEWKDYGFAQSPGMVRPTRFEKVPGSRAANG